MPPGTSQSGARKGESRNARARRLYSSHHGSRGAVETLRNIGTKPTVGPRAQLHRPSASHPKKVPWAMRLRLRSRIWGEATDAKLNQLFVSRTAIHQYDQAQEHTSPAWAPATGQGSGPKLPLTPV